MSLENPTLRKRVIGPGRKLALGESLFVHRVAVAPHTSAENLDAWRLSGSSHRKCVHFVELWIAVSIVEAPISLILLRSSNREKASVQHITEIMFRSAGVPTKQTLDLKGK